MYIVRRVLFILVAGICLFYTYKNWTKHSITVIGTPYIVDACVDTYCEPLSDNVAITTINGISNVYYNMAADGYSIYKEDITDKHIDVSFIKDNSPSYRFYYEYPEGRVTIFSSDYENSYIGLAYISVRKEVR